MEAVNNGQDPSYAPLVRIEAGIANEFTESSETPRPVLSARKVLPRNRARRAIGFATVAIGAVLLVTALVAQGGTGPAWARVQDAVRYICGGFAGLPPIPPPTRAPPPPPASPCAPLAPLVNTTTKGPGEFPLPLPDFTAMDAIHATAPNFTCFGAMNSSLPPVGTMLGAGAQVALIDAKCGGPYTISMPEDGVVTGIQPLATPGAMVNPGAQLALYVPAAPGVPLDPTGPGFKKVTNPATGQLAVWKVDKYDGIKGGDPVADFVLPDGTVSTVTYDGPDGMVLSRQEPLSAGDPLKGGAELVTVGQGIFKKHLVKANDVISKGDGVALIKTGDGVDKPIPVGEDATVVALKTPYAPEDPIGLDVDLKDTTFTLLGEHLPPLPTFESTTTEPNISEATLRLYEAPANAAPLAAAPAKAVQLYMHDDAPAGLDIPKGDELGEDTLTVWIAFKKYNVSVGDIVKKGDVIIICDKLKGATITGETVEFKADEDGYITHLQPLREKELIGPGDQLFEIEQEPAPAGSSLPWWALLLLCCLCCLLCLLLALCCQKEEPKPEPKPVVAAAPPPVVKKEEPKKEAPKPVPVAAAPAPAPVVAAAAVPEGVPIYFDGQAKYLKYQPIGIEFRPKAPIVVEEYIFNSYGKTLGIQKGQRLTKIVDIDVKEDHHYHEVSDKLHAAIKDLPYWPLRVDYKTETGQIVTHYYVERPLGILFTQHLPIKVEKFRPNSLAEAKGVKKGWEIVRIADEDTSVEGMKKIGITTNKKGYEHVDKHLLGGLAHLPQKK